MKKPSHKIIKKQIRRYNIEEGGIIPCMEKYWNKQIRSWEQQGYTKLSGPYWACHRDEWQIRGCLPWEDVAWAFRKKPGRKY